MHRRDPGVARDLLPAASLSELIGDPFGRWMCSNSEPQKLPPAMTHNQQAIEQPKRDCRHHEQVHRGNPISMVTKERPPSLRGRNPLRHHIFGHAGLADIDAKLEKLAMDPDFGGAQDGGGLSLSRAAGRYADRTRHIFNQDPERAPSSRPKNRRRNARGIGRDADQPSGFWKGLALRSPREVGPAVGRWGPTREQKASLICRFDKGRAAAA